MSITLIILTIIWFFSRSNWVQLWIILELNILFFINFILQNKESEINFIKYFIIQAFTSIIIIFRFLFKISNISIFVFIFILLKVGIFPFHNWIQLLSKNINKYSYLILITLQKIQIIYLVFLLFKNIVFFLVFSLLILTIYLIILKETFLYLFFLYSSMNFILLCFFICLPSLYFFLNFWILYSILFRLFIKVNVIQYTLTFFWKERKIIVLLAIMGFPPFPVFFYKIIIITWLFNISLRVSFLFIILSLFSVVVYRTIVFYIFFNKHIYIKISNNIFLL